MSRGAPGALAFAVVAVAFFLAHEPMAVIMGTRGIRVRDALVHDARRRLWLLFGIAGLGLVAAALLAPAGAWWGALVPAVPGLALAPLFFTNRVKTLPGEVVAAAAFSASLVPVALSGPASWAAVWLGSGVWFAATVPAIVSVHAVKAAHKGRPRSRWLVPAAPLLALAVMAGAVLIATTLPPPAFRALAALPPALAVLGVSLARPHPRHLKRIGWTMVVANTLTLILLLAL
jgi:hypothetical protein